MRADEIARRGRWFVCEGGMRAAGIATAAGEADRAFRCLARMPLHLDAVGLEVQDGIAEVIAPVGDIATERNHVAATIGMDEVERRSAAG